ncbi:helix-turn-helix domain-containing protein [Marinomonas balearica]|uniref:AraC family ethanolamine operon transcriptional activator n=1 Tax=Marinomonas balearica TaxID=491947 RepID=A0A4V3CFZ8_9GAMM|nr:helix-turn-helix domain-containing protein [Marinomonas balearica]TDO95782.1 AraC family ethanolamine operon transcriptional activator [Marinomonas balearica]
MSLHMNAPKRVNEIRRTEAFDADLHADNLTDWNQEYDQTSRGSFFGSITELAFSDLQVFQEYTSQALQQKCIVWSDSVWLGIPVENQEASRINGLSIHPNTIMCRPGDYEFQLTTPEDYDLYGMVVQLESLMNTAQIHGVELNWKELMQHGRLAIPEQTLRDVRIVLQRMLDMSAHTKANRMSHDVLMMALLEVLKEETPQPASTQTFHRRKEVVDAARSFIEAHSDTPLTVTDLCQVTNVSRRTLQYSFESIIGMSPIQYLRISRLNGARRNLLKSHGNATVSDVAATWGFWHLSQFAKDYKTLFGEKPSQTLEQTPQKI